MAKIIPFSKPKPAQLNIKDRTAGLEETIARLIPGLSREFRAIGVEIDPTLRIQAYLDKLRGAISKNAIITARQGLKLFSTEDLKQIARNSNQNQWAIRPGYFQALVYEIQSRQ